MGTRSTVIVKNEDGYDVIQLYVMYDGYWRGVGKDIVDYLNGKVVVNGIAGNGDGQFNGIGDLALRLAFHLKGGDKIGGVYAQSPDGEGEWCCYDVILKDSKICLTYSVGGRIIIDQVAVDELTEFEEDDE